MLGYSLKRTSDPATEPVTLDELKDHLRVASNDDDTMIAALLKAAREAVERDAATSLITQTWQLKLDEWPDDAIVLPNAPVQSVTSVTYTNTGGSSATWTSSEYDVDTASEPGLIREAYSYSWPDDRGDDRNIIVTYVTGFGDAVSSVPEEFKVAVKLRAELFYDGESVATRAAYDAIIGGTRAGVYP